MKKPLAALASAIVLCCAPGFGQAAPFASSDPAVAAATREMLAAMKARDMMTVVVAQLEQQIQRDRMMDEARNIVAKKLAPAQQAEELRLANARLAKANADTRAELADPALLDDMIGALVQVYAETYTLDEIRQMSAFYATPLGQKMQAKAPVLMQQSVDIARWFVMGKASKTAVKEEGQAALAR